MVEMDNDTRTSDHRGVPSIGLLPAVICSHDFPHQLDTQQMMHALHQHIHFVRVTKARKGGVHHLATQLCILRHQFPTLLLYMYLC